MQVFAGALSGFRWSPSPPGKTGIFFQKATRCHPGYGIVPQEITGYGIMQHYIATIRTLQEI